MLTRLYIAVALVICAAALNAEDLAGEVAETTAPAYEPMSLRQNYTYSLVEIFGPARLVTVAAQAGLDQMGDHGDGWGSHASSFGIRTASWFGAGFVRENIEFGVRVIDGENPRYVRSGKGSIARRTGYAVKRTFVARRRNGQDIPAYSALADFATPFTTQQWRHGAERGGRELRAGSIVFGSQAAVNVGREFWPDIKKKIHP